MTPDDVRFAITSRQHLAQQDPEAWHGLVDNVRGNVLKAVAAGHAQAADLAAAVLEADAIPATWTACA
jgi:hypothetical protein